MVVAERETTQERGIPITQEQLEKIMLLGELDCIDPASLLDTNGYSPDREQARRQFLDRFAFYDVVVELRELIKVQTLWAQFMDFCVPPQLLLDPSRYSSNLRLARFQFEQRLMVYDCFKGVMGIFGKVRVGKSGIAHVHTYHGREWFDLSVVTYKVKPPPPYGPYTYLNDGRFLDEIEKVTKLVEKGNGEWAIKWESEEARREMMSLFYNAQIIVEEAHKLFPVGSFTRLGKRFYEVLKEWGHYQCFVLLLTQYPEDLNRHVLKHLTHEVWVSKSYSKDRTSDVNIRHMETGERKPKIELYRPDYYPLWRHNAPIAASSNVSKREIDRRFSYQEEKEGKE